MKIKLIFTDWRKYNKEKGYHSVYNTEEGLNLSMGQFHSGTTFNGEIFLDIEDEQDLKESIKMGYEPIFSIDLSMNKIPTLLSTKEASEFLQVDIGTLAFWRFLKKGPKYLKFGRSIKYLQEDLQDFLKRSIIETKN